MRQLLANADDFGRHERINAAVEEAVQNGILRSATLMAGERAFDDAVRVARRNALLGVGIHFTLVNGTPVLPSEAIPSLVREDGTFYDDYGSFVKRYFAGRIRLEEVRSELSAQLEKLELSGLAPTHADSHQHIHVLPGILEIVLSLCEESDIGALRAPRAPLFAGKFGGLGQLIGRAGLAFLADRAARKARARGIWTPEHFAGIVAGEAVSEETLLEVIENLKEGTTEVMLHPGTDTALLSRELFWQHDFEAELHALTSPRVLEALEEGGIAPCNFSALE